MIGLTSRLNERDETIISMQQELAQNESRSKWLSVNVQRGQERIKQLEHALRTC